MFKMEFSKRVLFVGIPDMAYVCLDGLKMAGVNIVGVIGAKKNHATYIHFKNFVKTRDLNFIEYDNLEDEDFIQQIKDLNIDVAVVCSFNYKVPESLINAVKDGFINVHPSLLPLYRGGNPYSAVIKNGEKITGVTLHFMDSGFDTGDIIVQQKLPITPKETMGTLFNRLNLMSMELLVQVLLDYEKNPLPRIKQPKGEFIKGENLAESELIINFDEKAEAIERFIRSLNPFLGASSYYRNTLVKVFSAEVYTDLKVNDYPVGTIAKVDGDKFYITAAEGFIAPTTVQFGSFFTGSAKDFVEMLNPKVGERFE